MPARRDPGQLRDGFARWFHELRGAAVDVTLGRPQPGLSSETLFLDVVEDGACSHYVARLPPAGPALFPDYDLHRQQRVQVALAGTRIPVAAVVAYEPDPGYVDAEFLLMVRVSGQTLTTQPSYLTSGWLADAGPEVQRAVARHVAARLGELHRLDPDHLALGDVTGGGPAPIGMLDYWERYLDWATGDPGATAVYRQAIAWCRERAPEPAATSLLWGDPQLVNLVLDDDGGPAALLDWEMAALGPAEVDLAWFLVLHELAGETAQARLPGWPERAEFIDWYEQALGRSVRDLGWYEVLALLRSGAIVVRVGEVLRQQGVPTSWTSQVPQPRHLRRLIGD